MRRKLAMAAAAAAATAAAAVVLSGCSAGAAPSAEASSATPAPQRIEVYAASSLTATFTQLGTRFEASHPGVTVAFDFDGSSTLVQQLAQGAPADVFASADESNMGNAVKQHLISGDPVAFATNILEIATPPGNPAHIASFADLGKPGVKVVVCADGVPCGNALEQLEKLTGVTVKPVSQEQNVADVLAKVESGNANAGVVYVTDVKGAGNRVTGVPFADAAKVVNSYPIAVTRASKNAKLARQFVAFVTGPTGRAALSAAGFGSPQK